MRLYRPVGQAELDLIARTNYKEYPPRLPEQPIFYPVLNEKYAREIAEKWNKKSADSGYAGYVTTFEIDDAMASFSVDFKYSPFENKSILKPDVDFALQSLSVFTASVLYPETNKS